MGLLKICPGVGCQIDHIFTVATKATANLIWDTNIFIFITMSATPMKLQTDWRERGEKKTDEVLQSESGGICYLVLYKSLLCYLHSFFTLYDRLIWAFL